MPNEAGGLLSNQTGPKQANGGGGVTPDVRKQAEKLAEYYEAQFKTEEDATKYLKEEDPKGLAKFQKGSEEEKKGLLMEMWLKLKRNLNSENLLKKFIAYFIIASSVFGIISLIAFLIGFIIYLIVPISANIIYGMGVTAMLAIMFAVMLAVLTFDTASE